MVAQIYTEINRGFEGEEDGDPTGDNFGAVFPRNARVGEEEVSAALPVGGEFKRGVTAADIFDGEPMRRLLIKNLVVPLETVG